MGGEGECGEEVGGEEECGEEVGGEGECGEEVGGGRLVALEQLLLSRMIVWRRKTSTVLRPTNSKFTTREA